MGRHSPGTGRQSRWGLRAAAGAVGSAVRTIRLRKLSRLPRHYWRIWVAGWGLASLLCTLLTAGTLALISPWGCTPQSQVFPSDSEPAPSRLSQVIRVRLMNDVDELIVSASQPPRYLLPGAPERILNLPANVAVGFKRTRLGNWQCGLTDLGPGGDLVLTPAAVGALRIDGKPYRGTIRLVPVSAGKFDVVNDLNLDDYLKGVLARELYPNWHDEAYKAQAIAARTYALYERHTRDLLHWDVWADTKSQVYGGLSGETARSRAAVDATAGIVLAYGEAGDERIFKAYFSSCCGGVSQSAADGFREPVTPLVEQNVGALCSASPKYTWGPVVVSKQELTRRIKGWAASRGREWEAKMAPVYSIEVERSNRFGRPVLFRVTDKKGERYPLSGEELRWAVNFDAPEGQILWSSFVGSIVNESDRVRFIGGRGHGHGVGLCQWCTQARALAGIRHEDILTAAYPGARLLRAY